MQEDCKAPASAPGLSPMRTKLHCHGEFEDSHAQKITKQGGQSKWDKQMVNTKMADSNPAVSVTTLSINGFNTVAKFKDYQTE